MTDSDYFAEKADTLAGLADEAYADGQMFLSLSTYRKLKELALEWDNPYYRDFATVHIGICLWHVGQVEEALAETSQVLAGLDEKDLDDNRSWQIFHGLFRWIWISLHYRGKLAGIRDGIDKGHRFLEDIGLSSWRAPLLYVDAVLCRARGDIRKAIEFADQASGIRRNAPAGPGFVLSEYTWASARYRLDIGINDDVVRTLAREMLDVPTFEVTFVDPARGHQILSRSALQAGRHRDSLDHAIQTVAIYRDTNYPAGQIEAHAELADAYRALGKRDEALKEAETSVAIAEDYVSDLWRFEAHYALLEVYIARADKEEIREESSKTLNAAHAVDERLETTFNGEQVRKLWPDAGKGTG